MYFLYHGYWWPSDATSQGISSHGIDVVFRNILVNTWAWCCRWSGLLRSWWQSLYCLLTSWTCRSPAVYTDPARTATNWPPFWRNTTWDRTLETHRLGCRDIGLPGSNDIKVSLVFAMNYPLFDKFDLSYRQVSNISRTLVGNKIVDHSDVVGASPAALLQLHLHSPLNIWFQYIAQRQLQVKTRNI